MISKESTRLTAIFVCLWFLLQYVSSERLPASLLEANVNNSDDNTIADSPWLHPTSTADSDELSVEDNDSREMTQLLSKLLPSYSERDPNHPSSLYRSPARRSNFWKRANFWRKRANFWRRDLSSQEDEQVM